MAGIKISALPAVVAAQTTDFFPVVQGGVTSRETISQLITLLNSPSVLTGYLPITGGTMTGSLILAHDPLLPLEAATKQYVDLFASGFTVVLATQAATTANLNATQAGAGVGATLTNAGAMAAFTVDGYAAALNDRILVKNQTLSQHNGVYTVTTVGSGAVNWVLTRATDYDTPAEIFPGTLVTVVNGTVNATTSWLETATVVTVDTNPVVFVQFSFSPSDFLMKANNLSDVASVPASLVNLGLGVPTGTGNVARQTSPTLITPILGAATATSLQFVPSTGGIIGTTTNDNAGAGFVGEFISSNIPSASAFALVSTVTVNITSILVSAGDWQIDALISTQAGALTQTSALITSVSLVSNTMTPDTSPNSSFAGFNSHAGDPNQNHVLPLGSCRISVAVPTTIYLVVQAIFSGGGLLGSGWISARRVR